MLQGVDEDIFIMKEKIEAMWKCCQSQRLRLTEACNSVPGFTLAGDNVGKHRKDF